MSFYSNFTDLHFSGDAGNLEKMFAKILHNAHRYEKPSSVHFFIDKTDP